MHALFCWQTAEERPAGQIIKPRVFYLSHFAVSQESWACVRFLL
jgi:hypothetical protein